jgi:hypothetical protein
LGGAEQLGQAWKTLATKIVTGKNKQNFILKCTCVLYCGAF